MFVSQSQIAHNPVHTNPRQPQPKASIPFPTCEIRQISKLKGPSEDQTVKDENAGNQGPSRADFQLLGPCGGSSIRGEALGQRPIKMALIYDIHGTSQQIHRPVSTLSDVVLPLPVSPNSLH